MDYKQSGVDIDAGNEVVRRIKVAGARRRSRPACCPTSDRSAGCSTSGSTGLTRSRAGRERRRRRHQAARRVHDRRARHDRRRSRQPLRQRHPGAGRAARSSSSTISRPGASIPTSRCRSSRGSRAPAARTAARCSAARRRRCRASTPTASTTSPASSWASVTASALIDGRAIAPGDVLIGLPSSGLHTNGYSLARRIVFDVAGLSASTPRARARLVDRRRAARAAPFVPAGRPPAARRPGCIKGMAHITGGGITDNLPRMLPRARPRAIDRSAVELPPIFQWLQRTGDVPDDGHAANVQHGYWTDRGLRGA